MTPQERFVSMARAEVGYREKATNSQLDNPTANPGTGNWNKYAAILDQTDIMNGPKNGADWCASFVVCMFYLTFGVEVFRKITGIPVHSLAAGVGYLRQYFANIGGLVSIPQPGDVIFFKTANGTGWQHTGIVERVEGGMVYTIEGNAGTPQGVNTFVYPTNYARIGGYGRAKWELVDVDPGEGSAWSTEARKWAIQNGLFAGDENGDYHWKDPVTREQLAQVLYNAHQPA